MPLPRQILEEMGQRRRAEHELAERDRRRDHFTTALKCLFWLAVGLLLLAWSFHTTNQAEARIAFLAGLALGNGGIIYTLLAAYRRGEKRGDW